MVDTKTDEKVKRTKGLDFLYHIEKTIHPINECSQQKLFGEIQLEITRAYFKKMTGSSLRVNTIDRVYNKHTCIFF